MATYDLEEQEQISALKAWWNQYGNLTTAVLTAVAVGMVGWQGWNWYQRKQSAEASAVFGVLQRAAAGGDAKKARDAGGELIEKYAGTAYAGMGALLSGKALHESGDLKSARAQFAWAASNAATPEMRDLARLRLAVVMLDEGAHEDALKQLDSEPLPAFAARYAELRGDIQALRGKTAEARAAYQAALDKLGPADKAKEPGQSDMTREVIQTKLEALGGAK